MKPQDLEFLEFQMGIVQRYAPLLEDIGANIKDLSPFDLFILHLRVYNDSWFSERAMEARKRWEAENPQLSSAQKQMADCSYNFPRTAAQRLTEDEKYSLRQRLEIP